MQESQIWDGDGVEDVTDYNGSAPDMGAFESQMAAPSDFSLFASSNYVVVTWLETEEEGFQYYLLERSTDSEFNEDVVSNFLITNYFEDHDIEFNTEYFYRVSYNAGEWSEYSEVLAITLEQLNVGKTITCQGNLHFIKTTRTLLTQSQI